MKCNCDKWENGIAEINGIFSNASVHGAEYNGEVFRYCPWCGAKLEFSAEEELLINIFGKKGE